MTEDQPATRRELDILREEFRRLDGTGTVVSVLQSQMTDLVKDVTELKADMNNRFDTHRLEHEKAQRDRVVGRRWLIGTGVGGLAAMAAVLGLLVEILARVH